MDKHIADSIICEYTQKIYGFALSKTHSLDSAQELASRITLEVYSSLLSRNEIANVGAYIWQIAMNVRARFIDEQSHRPLFSTDELELPDNDDPIERFIDRETQARLRLEIAHLSRLRRSILMLHYYKGMKLSDIADTLSIPSGTVKWHLSAARDELREGFTKMRTLGKIGIEPITLTNLGHDGTPGSLGSTEHFLKNRLTQNIVWTAYKKPRTISEIADELGVNPLFIEDEIATLEEYGFLDRIGEKLRANILIDDTSPETIEKTHELYVKYAKKLAETYPSRILEAAESLDRSKLYVPGKDENLFNWSFMTLSLFLRLNIAFDAEKYDSFKVARKDGGRYVAFASVAREYELSFDARKYSACGPMNRGSSKYPIYSWQLTTYYDSRILDWKDNRYEDYDYLYEFYTDRIKKEPENLEKYTRLRDKGYLTENDEVNIIAVEHGGKQLSDTELIKAIPSPNAEESSLILELSEKLCDLLLPQYPEHMREVARLYNSNPAISRYMLEQLVDKGILTLPSPKRAPGLCTILFADRLPKQPR